MKNIMKNFLRVRMGILCLVLAITEKYLGLIEKQKDKLFWNHLIKNSSVYDKILKPHLTEDLIEIVLEKINQAPNFFDIKTQNQSNLNF